VSPPSVGDDMDDDPDYDPGDGGDSDDDQSGGDSDGSDSSHDEDPAVARRVRSAMARAARGAKSRRDLSAAERWAPTEVDAVVRSSSGTFVGENLPWKSYRVKRNEKESDLLCAVLDCLVANKRDDATELLVRRLIGIREHDKDDSWDAADSLDIWSPRRIIGTIDQRRRLRKDVAHLRSQAKSSVARAPGSRRERRATDGTGDGDGATPVSAKPQGAGRGGVRATA
jgi:hypothetical protein